MTASVAQVSDVSRRQINLATVSSEFIFLQRALDELQSAHGQQEMIGEVATASQGRYEDVSPSVDETLVR